MIQQYLASSDGSLESVFLFEDARTQDAVLRRLETLSDAARHLSADLKCRHQHIPWRQIADFRNVLAHGYTDINIERVWQVIVEDLPQLKAVTDAERA
jgi:uncharacterized protein with HEPN domain